MELLGIASGLGILVASLVIGARLLWMGRGDLTAPESLLGLALFTGGAVAFPLSSAANQTALDPALRVQLGAASYAGSYVMLLGKAAFVWTVFRRSERWAAAAHGWQRLGAGIVMLYPMYRMPELDRQIETLRRFKEVAPK